jgi:hypothetical protein
VDEQSSILPNRALMMQTLPDIAWGKRTRVILDVGCGVASFGGFLFDRDVLAMSLAPKDEHEAQVHFALERRIPAISAAQRGFPSLGEYLMQSIVHVVEFHGTLKVFRLHRFCLHD